MVTDNKLEEVNILLCEDDESLGMLLREYLEAKGYHTTLCQDGEEGFETFLQGNFSLCILDVMMPRMDGFTLAKKIRELNYEMPFMFLTAKNLKDDVREGFELGADDFVVKPFDMKELLARVKAVLRRYSVMETHLDKDTLRFDNLEISLSNHELKIKGVSVDIPNKEFMLLHFLAKNFNRVFTRDQLLNKVWSFDYLGDSRTVDVHVKRLREKLTGVSDKWELRTVWGVGYKFETKE